MLEIPELLDLEKTIAAELFDNIRYPWEALGRIKEFIIRLGKTLPEDSFSEL